MSSDTPLPALRACGVYATVVSRTPPSPEAAASLARLLTDKQRAHNDNIKHEAAGVVLPALDDFKSLLLDIVTLSTYGSCSGPLGPIDEGYVRSTRALLAKAVGDAVEATPITADTHSPSQMALLDVVWLVCTRQLRDDGAVHALVAACSAWGSPLTVVGYGVDGRGDRVELWGPQGRNWTVCSKA
jgi:hypothetical protein